MANEVTQVSGSSAKNKFLICQINELYFKYKKIVQAVVSCTYSLDARIKIVFIVTANFMLQINV